MKFRIVLAALVLALGGCVTTPKIIPPLELSPGNGAMAIDVTISNEATKNFYIFKIAQYTPDTRRVIMLDGHPKHEIAFSKSILTEGPEKDIWVSELPSGSYVITEMQAKLRTGLGDGSLVPYGTNPLALLLAGVTVIAISESTVDILPFIDKNGQLLPDAPTFEITEGRISYLGNLMLTVDSKTSDFPDYGNDGHWDGETMISKVVKRYMADYRYDESDLAKHHGRLNLSVYPLQPQPLAIFDDRRFILEDFENAETVRRSIPRSENDMPAKATASTGTPVSGKHENLQ